MDARARRHYTYQAAPSAPSHNVVRVPLLEADAQPGGDLMGLEPARYRAAGDRRPQHGAGAAGLEFPGIEIVIVAICAPPDDIVVVLSSLRARPMPPPT